MTIPEGIRNTIKDLLWQEADRLDWANLSATEKARYYSQWTEATDIGGQLGVYMDPRQIRVYLKDTLLKSYTRDRLADPNRIFRVLGIEPSVKSVQSYIKPHGRRLSDGRIIAWSRATEWKLTLLAVFERAFAQASFTPYAAVLLQSSTKYASSGSRAVVEDAAIRLGLDRIVWLD
jgi:hypothetical protein